MPIEFKQLQQPTGSSGNSLFRLTMAYDGSGRRISKTRWVKSANSQDWEKELVTHYTGIGTEIRENYHNESLDKAKVVVNMPQGLGRYGIEDADHAAENGSAATSALQIATQFGSCFDFWAFDSYMAKLTLFTSIRGSSIEDINAKIAWAVDYAMPMYQNDVEKTNDVREAFDASYRQKFYPVVEEE